MFCVSFSSSSADEMSGVCRIWLDWHRIGSGCSFEPVREIESVSESFLILVAYFFVIVERLMSNGQMHVFGSVFGSSISVSCKKLLGMGYLVCSPGSLMFCSSFGHPPHLK